MLILKLTLLTLVVGACSTGVTEEEHAAVLEEVSQLEDEAAGLESSIAELDQQLAASEGELESAEASIESLEGDLSAADDEVARAVDRYGDLVDLSGIPNANAATLIFVSTQETLRCGIAASNPGFSETNANGRTTGFDADFCRAFAAAVLGDADAVEFVPTTGADRFDTLRFGLIDVLMRNTTWTLNRDAAGGEGVDFGPTTYYDGQQFMGRSGEFATSSGSADVNGALLCVQPGTRQEANAIAWAASSGSTFELAPHGGGSFNDEVTRLQNGVCDLITAEGSLLAMSRFEGFRNGTIESDELVIFPAAPITREPLGPVYRQGDTIWADIIAWVVHATIIADEKSITSANIDTVEWDPETQRLFGVEGTLVSSLGLNPDALYQVIKQVGNYSEIFDRNLDPLQITREGTQNAPHTAGGLIYAPPAR